MIESEGYCKGKGLFIHIVPRFSIVKDYAHNRSNVHSFRMSWNHGGDHRYSIDRKRVVRLEGKDVIVQIRRKKVGVIGIKRSSINRIIGKSAAISL